MLKQTRLLVRNLYHTSLRPEKYSESEDLWQARASNDWRLCFTIKGDTYHIQSITPHPE